MCYSIRTKIKNQLERYAYWKDYNQGLYRKLELAGTDLFFGFGFDHPQVYIYTNREPYLPVQSMWGLIPSRSKTRDLAYNTLNAEGETIFKKPTYAESANKKRCLIYVEGFYEHYHFKNNTYPHYVTHKDGSSMIFAGLWNDWTDSNTGEILNTFSIVTTTANPLMARIHNNPKLSEPRMPVILPHNYANEWLRPINSDSDKQYVQSLITPYDEGRMEAYTVAKLRGEHGTGNTPDANRLFVYPELDTQNNQLSFF